VDHEVVPVRRRHRPAEVRARQQLPAVAADRPDGQARAACFHFEPGDRVGRHEADIRQLFCVVAGEGWTAGPDGARVPIGTGEAALFEPGEDHEAGTDTGMTAIVLEGDLEVWAAPGRAEP
jgi:quercetin dioxygenase-like cupin family protein